jgi:hypothetical protein
MEGVCWACHVRLFDFSHFSCAALRFSDFSAFLAAAGQLKQLNYLCVDRDSGLTERGPMQLTVLSCSRQLYVGKSDEVTNEVLERFWAAVRQQ